MAHYQLNYYIPDPNQCGNLIGSALLDFGGNSTINFWRQRDKGQIALKLYDELTLTRALSTALAALRQQGLPDAQALQHVAAFLDPSAQPPVPLLLLRKTAFTQEDGLALGAVARRAGFVPLFPPEVWAEPPLDSV